MRDQKTNREDREDPKEMEWISLGSSRFSLARLGPGAMGIALALLCAIAYLPALNNGFISDDFVILERVTAWKSDLSYLFRMSPEKFRITSYLVFGLLKDLIGFHPAGFYVCAILLHFLNAVLVWKFLGLMTGSPRAAGLGSVLFAVGQSPQEAVMWLAGINESLLAFFILLTLLFWLREKFLWSSAACIAALFSKESAAAIVLLLPLVGFAAGRNVFRRLQVLYIGIPVLLFAGIYISALSDNALVGQGFYGLGLHALMVWIKSLHRLMFPWLYLAILLWVATARGGKLSGISAGLIWMAAALIPYIFLTYQDHVPSRHTYLASIGFAWILAQVVEKIRMPGWQTSFLAAFLVVNIAYLWIVKDRQYEQRSAPTARLMEQLRSHPPGPVIIDAFPLNPWIAKMTTRLVPGWDPRMLRVNEPAGACPGCLKLRWDPKTENYSTF